MTDMLTEVKRRLLISGDYQDEMLASWIDSCKTYLINGGGNADAIETPSAYGVITQGVYDMWTNKEFSPIFRDMVVNWILANPTPSESEIKGAELATNDNIYRPLKDVYEKETER